MLNAAIEGYCLFIGTLFSAVVLVLYALIIDFFYYMSVTHDKSHIKPHQISRNIIIRG